MTYLIPTCPDQVIEKNEKGELWTFVYGKRVKQVWFAPKGATPEQIKGAGYVEAGSYQGRKVYCKPSYVKF